MTSHDLNRAFEAFAPTAEQEQAMLDRLLTEQKEVRPVNRIKKMTVVLVAAALMLMACAFTVVTGLDQRILSYFGGGEEQAQLVSGGVVEVEKRCAIFRKITIRILHGRICEHCCQVNFTKEPIAEFHTVLLT